MKSLSVGSIVWLVAVSLSVPLAQAVEPWQSQGPSGTNFHSLAQAPDGTILAGTVSGLFRFDDSEQIWLPTPFDQSRIGQVFVASDGTVFAETYSDGCVAWYGHFVSVDTGESWSVDEGIPEGASVLAFVETLDGTVWTGLWDGTLLRRRPGDSEWSQHPSIESIGGLRDLAATSDGSLVLLASDADTGESLVLHSDNGGESWSIRLRTAPSLRELTASPAGFMVAAGYGTEPDTVAFFTSPNSGRDWFERPCTTGACEDLISVDGLAILQNRSVVAVGRAPDRVSSRLIVSDLFMEQWNPAAVFSRSPRALLTDRSGSLWVAGLGFAWCSIDNAASFEPVSAGVVETSITSLAPSGEHLFAVVGTYGMGGWAGIWSVPGTAGVHVSADDGATWTSTSVWQANQVTESFFLGVLAATDMGVLQSLDHGATWKTIPVTDGVPVRAAAEDRFGTLCVISGLHLRCADNDALDWHSTRELIHSDNVLAVAPDGAFLGEISGIVHRSIDGGRTWEPTLLEEDVTQIAVSPDGVVFAIVSSNRRIAVSDDSGITWEFRSGPSDYASSIAFHPVAGVLVGSRFRVYVSNDGFETWTWLGLSGRSLLVTGDRLVAGSERNGVWLADLPPKVRRPTGRIGSR